MNNPKTKVKVTTTAREIFAKIVCYMDKDGATIKCQARNEKEMDRILIHFFLQLPERKRAMLRAIDEDDADVKQFIEECETARKPIKQRRLN